MGFPLLTSQSPTPWNPTRQALPLGVREKHQGILGFGSSALWCPGHCASQHLSFLLSHQLPQRSPTQTSDSDCQFATASDQELPGCQAQRELDWVLLSWGSALGLQFRKPQNVLEGLSYHTAKV